jgi:hypothetical protein
MGAKSLNDITRKGLHVLAVVIDSVTGLLTAELGDVVKQQTSSSECEVYSPSGVVGIPQKPDAGSAAAEVLVIKNSGHDAIAGFRDARWAALVNAVGLDYGETLVFSPAGGGYVVFRKDKSVQLFNGDLSSFVKLNGDGTIVAGDDNAKAVTYADKFEVLRQAVITLAGTNAANGIPPMDVATVAKLTADTADNATTKFGAT